MKKRVISSIVGLPLAITAIFLGGNILLFFIVIVSFIGLFEFYRAFEIENKMLRSVGFILSGAFFIIVWLYNISNIYIFVTIYILLLLILFVLKYPTYHIKDILVVFFATFYVCYLMVHIYLVREIPQYGVWLVWLIFMSAWGCDTFAYFTGIAIGKHKLAPILSPKKTIEGSIGGIIGAILLCVGYSMIIVQMKNLPNNYILYYAIIGGIGSVLSQIGDLAASAIKRMLDVKDFGNIIPGHGGILDRMDSILFTAPFVYLLATWLL